MSKPDGGPAFPRPYGTDEHENPCNANTDQAGMSVRQWYAGNAPATPPSMLVECGGPSAGWVAKPETIAKITARWNHIYADAMIAEGEK